MNHVILQSLRPTCSTAPNGKVTVEVLLNHETIWLTQKRISELFGVGVPAISKHLKNIVASGELVEEGVIAILENTTEHGTIDFDRAVKKY